jgi:hypothetical protein
VPLCVTTSPGSFICNYGYYIHIILSV